MAGSYKHCISEDGQLLEPEQLAEMLENGGDVHEAIEEMYGMIWWLASSPTPHLTRAEKVRRAMERYKIGLERSPGTRGRL